MPLAPKLAAAGNTHTKTFPPPQPPSVLAAISKAMMSVVREKDLAWRRSEQYVQDSLAGGQRNVRVCQLRDKNPLYCYCSHTQEGNFIVGFATQMLATILG